MAKKKKSTKKNEMIVVSSKAKVLLKKAGCNTASGALEALNEVLYWYVAQAAARAKANGRKTVRDYDFMA